VDYVSRWQAEARTACLSPKVAQLQDACFRDRAIQLQEVTRQLQEASDPSRSSMTVDRLPAIETCVDPVRVRTEFEPGEAAATLQRAELSRINALYIAGRYTEAEEALRVLQGTLAPNATAAWASDATMLGARIAVEQGQREKAAALFRQVILTAE